MAGIRHVVAEREITAGGGTITVNFNLPYSALKLYTSGAVALAANWSVTSSGTLRTGAEFLTYCDLDGVTLGANTITIFGESISQAVLTNCNFLVKSIYDGTKFITNVIPSASDSGYIVTANLADDAVTTAKVTDDAITNDLLANITRGSIKVGGALNAPTDLAALTSGQVVMGDGTDVVSLPISGHVTLSGTGQITIANSVITQAMLAFTLQEYLSTTITLSSAQILTLFATPVTILSAPGSGKYYELVSCSAYNNFNTAAFANGADLLELRTGANINWSFPNSFTEAGADQVHQGTQGTAAIGLNTALTVTTTAADPTFGDGAITLNIIYRIVTV